MEIKEKKSAVLSKALIRLGYLLSDLNPKEIESLVLFIEDLIKEINVQEAARLKRIGNR